MDSDLQEYRIKQLEEKLTTLDDAFSKFQITVNELSQSILVEQAKLKMRLGIYTVILSSISLVIIEVVFGKIIGK